MRYYKISHGHLEHLFKQTCTLDLWEGLQSVSQFVFSLHNEPHRNWVWSQLLPSLNGGRLVHVVPHYNHLLQVGHGTVVVEHAEEDVRPVEGEDDEGEGV